MDKFMFVSRLLPKLSEGSIFRDLFAWAIKALAVVIGLMGLLIWLGAWGMILRQGIGGLLGGLLFQALFVIAVYVVIHVMWIRSNDVRSLEPGDYTIIPIVAVIIRMMGEISASFIAVMSVAAGLFMWFAGHYPDLLMLNLVPSFTWGGEWGAGSFLGGIYFMISGGVTALLMLAVYYLAAELIMVIVDIAGNLKAVRRSVEQKQD